METPDVVQAHFNSLGYAHVHVEMWLQIIRCMDFDLSLARK